MAATSHPMVRRPLLTADEMSDIVKAALTRGNSWRSLAQTILTRLEDREDLPPDLQQWLEVWQTKAGQIELRGRAQ